MSYFRLGDPEDDFDRRDEEEARWLAQLPKCDYCGEPIQDEEYFKIHEEVICESCLEQHFKVINQYL